MLGVFEGYVGIYFCRGSSFEVVEVLRKGFIVKFVVWGELRQEVVFAHRHYLAPLPKENKEKSHLRIDFFVDFVQNLLLANQ